MRATDWCLHNASRNCATVTDLTIEKAKGLAANGDSPAFGPVVVIVIGGEKKGRGEVAHVLVTAMGNTKMKAVSRASEASVKLVYEVKAFPSSSEGNFDLGIQPPRLIIHEIIQYFFGTRHRPNVTSS